MTDLTFKTDLVKRKSLEEEVAEIKSTLKKRFSEGGFGSAGGGGGIVKADQAEATAQQAQNTANTANAKVITLEAEPEKVSIGARDSETILPLTVNANPVAAPLFGAGGISKQNLTNMNTVSVDLTMEGLLGTIFDGADSILVEYYDGSWNTLMQSPSSEWTITDVGGTILVETPDKTIPAPAKADVPLRISTVRASIGPLEVATSASAKLNKKRG